MIVWSGQPDHGFHCVPDGLQFESRRNDTADVDEVTITPMMRSAAEEVANAARGKGSERSGS